MITQRTEKPLSCGVMRSSSVAVLLLLGGALMTPTADAHGTLLRPVSRAVHLAGAAVGANGSDATALAGGCFGGVACTWYNQDVSAVGPTQICDPALRTMGVSCTSKSPPDWPCTPGASVPWCSPGTAVLQSPCGVFSGGWRSRGRDMRELAPAPREVWDAGSTQRVRFSVIANHGGGYSYRLCPASSSSPSSPWALPTEACFQAHHLRFNGTEQRLIGRDGSVLATFDAIRTSNGTYPPHSQWTRNPIAMEEDLWAPAPMAKGRGPFGFAVEDSIEVPASLPSGEYTLSWRWDAEQTKQVWSQCADVHIVNGVSHSPDPNMKPPPPSSWYETYQHPLSSKEEGYTHPPPVSSTTTASSSSSWPSSSSPSPPPSSSHRSDTSRRSLPPLLSPSPSVCTGGSLGLDVVDCASWMAIFDALGGPNWPASWTAGPHCSDLRADPCGCNSGAWDKYINCNAKRGVQRITELYLLGPTVQGEIPEAISHLSALVALSLVETGIRGALPSSFGQLGALEMLWLDHNPHLGGSLPASFAGLTSLTAIELHRSNFSGPLPLLPWDTIPDCTLNNLSFACPLPPGAAKCGASCT
jgi:hypothetical protein